MTANVAVPSSGSIGLSTLVPCFRPIPESQEDFTYFIPFDANGTIITDLSQIDNINYLFAMHYADPNFYCIADNYNPDFVPEYHLVYIPGFTVTDTTLTTEDYEFTITFSYYELSTIKLADLPTLGQYS